MKALLAASALAAVLLGGAAGCGSRPPASSPPAGERPAIVADAWARATPAGASMGAVYMTLRSAAEDRLIGAKVSPAVAARAELHQVVTDGRGQMTMRRVEAIELPAGVPVRLEPGASHLMLVDLARPLVAGDTLKATLRFEKAGNMTVRVPVRGV